MYEAGFFFQRSRDSLRNAMSRFGKIVLTLLILLPLIGSTAMLVWLDGTDLRPFLQGTLDRLSAAVGRRITVSDYLWIDVSWNPTVHVGGLTVANADWGKADYALRVDKAEVQVSVLGLLRGEFALRRVDVDGARASIERNERGKLNWRIKDPEEVERVLSPLIALVRGADVMASSLDIRVRKVAIDYYDYNAARTLSLEVETASLLRQRRGEPISASIDCRLAGEPLKLAGYVSATDSLKRHQVMVMVSGRQGVALAEGTIVDKAGIPDVDLNLHIGLSGLARVNQLLNTNLPALAPITLSAHVRSDGSRLSLSGINSLIGSAEMTGQIHLDHGHARPVFDVDLAVRNLNTAEFRSTPLADEPQADNSNALLDRRFSLAWLDTFDLSGRVKLEDAVIERVPITRAEAQISLVSGRLELTRLTAVSPAGTVESTGTLEHISAVPVLRVRLGGKLIPSRLVDPKEKESVVLDGTVGVNTSGDTLRQLLDRALLSADFAAKSDARVETVRFEQKPAARLPGRAEFTHTLDGAVTVSGVKYTFDMNAAAPSLLFDTGTDYPLQVNLHRNAARLSLDGHLSDIMNHLNIDFAVDGGFAPTAPATGNPWLPVRVSGRLQGSLKAGEIALSKGTLNVPTGKGSARLTLNWSGQKPRLSGEVAFKGEARHIEKTVDSPDQIRTQTRPDIAWLDAPLPLGALQLLDADLALSGEHVAIGPVNIVAAHGRLALANGRIKGQLDASIEEGAIGVHLDLNSRGPKPSLQVNVQSESLDVTRLLNSKFKKGQAKFRLAANLTWVGRGSTLYELLDEISGQVRLSRQGDGGEQVVAGTFKASQRRGNRAPSLEVLGAFQVKGHPVSMRFVTPEWRRLLMSSQPVPVKLDLSSDHLRATVDGEVANLISQPAVDLNAWIDAPSLELLRPLLHDGAIKLAPFTLRAGIALGGPSGKQTVEVRNLLINAGPGRVDGRLRLASPGGRPRIDGELNLVNLDLSWESPSKPPPAEQEAKGSTEERVFSSERFDNTYLRGYDANLVLSTKNIRLPGRILRGFTVSVNLDEGRMKVDLQSLEAVGDKAAHASLRLDARTDVTAFDLALHSSAVDLRTLLSRSSVAGMVTGNMAVDVTLRGRGASMAEMMASLDGDIKLVLENGTAKAEALDSVVGGVRAVLGQVFAKKSKESKIICALCDLSVASGVVSTRLALVDTDYSLILAEGTVDLGQERLKLKVTPQAKGVTLSVASPVLISGSLSDPRFNIDTKGAVDKVVELLTVIAYPPVLIVGMEDMMINKDNPCITMVKPKSRGPIRRFIQGLKPKSTNETKQPPAENGGGN